MRDGDRVLRVGTEAVTTWEQMRAVVKRQTEPVDIEVERGGHHQVSRVAPRDGRIAVAVQMAHEKLAPALAFGRAAALPSQIVAASAKSFWAAFTEQATADVGGPVRILQETGKVGIPRDRLRAPAPSPER